MLYFLLFGSVVMNVEDLQDVTAFLTQFNKILDPEKNTGR